jgi:hypothetical protein
MASVGLFALIGLGAALLLPGTLRRIDG